MEGQARVLAKHCMSSGPEDGAGPVLSRGKLLTRKLFVSNTLETFLPKRILVIHTSSQGHGIFDVKLCMVNEEKYEKEYLFQRL